MQLITDKQLMEDLRHYKPVKIKRNSHIMQDYNEEKHRPKGSSVRVLKAIVKDMISKRNYNKFLKEIRSKK